MQKRILTILTLVVSLNVSTAAYADTLPDSQTQDSAITRKDDEEGFDQVRHALSNLTGFIYDGTIKDALEFFKPHKSGNGRACATCHRPEDNFALTPATVEARYQALQARRKIDPTADDPLFRPIDADEAELLMLKCVAPYECQVQLDICRRHVGKPEPVCSQPESAQH
jgi:hypothetical protein